jgi:carboxymethylenebutenolidase
MDIRWTSYLGLVLLLILAGCGGGDSGQQGEESYADTMAQQHADDTPEATAMAQEPMIPVVGATVAYGTTPAGESITGYIARPENPDSVLDARGMDPATSELPGVVVIHEWWGLNDNIRAATRRLAGQGYEALAVDLYEGGVAETPSEARGLMEQAMQNRDRLIVNLEAAHNFLSEEIGSPRVGVMGWCFGGGMALNAALADPQTLDATVIYYGRVSDAERSELETLQMPIMGHFGMEDSSIPVESVRQFEQMLNELDKNAQIYLYEGAGHAFSNPSGQNYDPEAAAQAWERTTEFLRTHLYQSGDENASS